MKISKKKYVFLSHTPRRQREWLLWAPFQGFRIFYFNISSRIGPIYTPVFIPSYLTSHILPTLFSSPSPPHPIHFPILFSSLYLTCTSDRGHHHSPISLTANRQSGIQALHINENLVDLLYEPREVWTVKDLHHHPPKLREFDFVGVLVRIEVWKTERGGSIFFR